ncbi:MAG: hypothetical protein U0R80_11095 [Nocardioidaceae bacterium]
MSAARHRLAVPRRGRGRLRVRVLGAAVTLLLLVASGPGHALWTASSTGSYGLAQATTLTAPTLTAGTATATTMPLSWTRPYTPTSYALAQSPGSLGGCAAAPGSGSSSCTATGLTPNTSYTWTLTANLSSWSKTATVTATTSKQSTTTTLSNLTPTSASQGTMFSATATVAGWGTPAGTVVFSLFTSSSCTGGASYTSSAQALSSGSATGTFQPTAGTYYWQATYTPSDSFNLTSTSACSAAVTVTAPTSSIVFNYYNISLTNYNVSGRPTAFTGSLSVQNSGGSVQRTLTGLTVTTIFPDNRVSGAAPSSVTGTGWAYQSSSHVGATWVYTFTWTGSLAPFGSTSDLGFLLNITDNSPGSATTTATASNPFTNTATVTLAGSI